MPDRTSLAEQQLVAGHLRELKSLDRLRRLLADLDYRVSDEPVSTLDWKPELAKSAKDGDLRTVARHQDFVVTYCCLQELRVSPEREVVTRLVRQYDHGLFAFSDLEESHWHLVNVKRDSRRHNRLVLRRIAIGPEEQLRTAIERISLLKVKDASWSGLEVELKHEEAFDVEKVTDQFYWDYKDIFDHIVGRLQHQVNLRTARAFAQQFMNRMMFLYFLQKKGWLDGRRDFVPWLWQKYQEDPAAEGNFYTRYLDPLFFLGFTSPSDDLTPSVTKQQLYARQDIPDEIKQAFLRLPFLNGGLFSTIEGIDDQGLEILDSEFENLFENLLEHYNFTVSEDTPLDVEVAVNPEMLGKVYENLVLEEERGKAGIFYTPRVELDFMCRRALMEYLDEEPIVDRPDLIRLVMNADTPEFVPDFSPERLREISRKLDEVTVVDPACGSGAFLVGMMQVLSGLRRLICDRLGEAYHDFDVKKRIIGENLFGVDIKDWAVRVAELRLWLSLIIQATLDEAQEEPGKAILPNLTFRIQTGDSLVEEIAGRSLSLRGRYSQMSPEVRRRINHLVDRKMDYYYNRGEVMPPQEIRRLETEVFQAILDDELGQVDKELRRLRAAEQEGFQRELDIAKAGGPARVGHARVTPEKARLRQRIEELERERAEIMAIRQSPDIERGKGPFLWDIEFAEVFQHRGGFDIVIGNPPYVRSETIAPANLLASEVTDLVKRQYKEQLQHSLSTHWGTGINVAGQADLYVYFYIHGLALLKPKGILCFITSNAWLDVDYGADLQDFLLRHAEVLNIYDNHAKRSFARSAVNTVIVLFRRPSDKADPTSLTRFVAFKKPFDEVLTADNLIRIDSIDSICLTDEFRVYPMSQGELWQAGLDSEVSAKQRMDLGFGHGVYVGNKWGGKYLRAPDIFFTILQKARRSIISLGRMGLVRYPIKTGINEFFYVTDSTVRRFGIEPEFLIPVVKSPKDFSRIRLRQEDVKVHLFSCELSHEELSEAGKKGALSYIAWGEKQVTKARQKTPAGVPWPLVPSVSGRKQWYSIGNIGTADVVCSRFFDRRFFFGFSDFPVVEDQTFYGLIFNPSYQPLRLAQTALLNTTLSYLFVELLGRVALGQGVLQYARYDMERLLVVDVSILDESIQRRLIKALDNLVARPILPIFQEVLQQDRRSLDAIIFEAIGLTSSEIEEVYRSVVALVQDRISKADSV